jgi:glycosyltransferase involved in cell wall biosynthesis
VKIALDAGCSLSSEPSGVAAYCSNLVRELTRGHPEADFLLAYRSNRVARAFREAKPAPNCTRVVLEGAATRLWSGRVDLFHGLNQRLPGTRFRSAVVTFHDLFVMTGEYSTPEYRGKLTELAKRAAGRADRIIAVSDFTAAETARLLGYPRERIATVHHGIEAPADFPADELEAFRSEFGLEGPFLLHVGAIQTRKNCLRLVEAFERLPGAPKLVFAGAAGFGADETLARIDLSPARARIFQLGYIDGGTRAKLYRTAAALAFPSLDEGFGLPVLEAMAAGLPVLTSNRSALPEVAGDAALVADPFDTEALAAGLTRLLEDEQLRADLIERGLERAGGFTWRRAAEQTWRVYEQALSLA